MSDKAEGAQKPFVPEKAAQKKTASGPHGGGTRYYDGAKLVNNKFVVHDGPKGHTQKPNVK